MSRKTELIALLVADTLALSGAFALYTAARFAWGWFGEPPLYMAEPLLAMTFMDAAWLVLFSFSGLYRERYAESRFDELVTLAKVVTVGVLAWIFAVFVDALEPGSSRSAIFFYWCAVFGFVALGRLVVRSVQKALILRGYGLHRALVVGWSDRVEALYEEVARYPEAGLKVVGAVRMQRADGLDGDGLDGDGLDGDGLDGDPPHGDPPHGDGTPGYHAAERFVAAPEPGGRPEVLAPAAGVVPDVVPEVAAIEALPRLIDELDVQDVLIALGSDDHHALLEVLRLCDGRAVSLKLVPDFYSVVGGMARTEHIYGLPLIEVLPEPMPPWEQSTKRLFDLAVALVVLVLGLPLWLGLALLVRLSSSGPAIYRQERVGQHGRTFTMLKFRTMHADAEAGTGPVWAQADDPRYTPIGRWLRRTRLDEVPQLWNVLRGEMSLVGPRPERPFFVERLAREIPLYSRRHRVKPGITGWAQVKWKYDASLEDVRQKVKYDLFYIENMNLRMDFKILFRTIRTALLGKGQ